MRALRRVSVVYSGQRLGVAAARPLPTLGFALSESRKRSQLPPKTGPRVLLQQGPVAPFLRHLQYFLEKNGFDTWLICFNAGDRRFPARENDPVCHDDIAAWPGWLRNLLVVEGIDHIVLFGAERPVHNIARELASSLGIDVVSLEEGYVHPGFVTVERGGNNWTSPIAGEGHALFLAGTFMMRDKDVIYVANHPTAELGTFLSTIVSPVVGAAERIETAGAW